MESRPVVTTLPAMSESAITPLEVPDAIPPDLVEVGSYRTYAEGSNHGLVVLALRQPYWLVATGNSFRLLVDPGIAETARHELECLIGRAHV